MIKFIVMVFVYLACYLLSWSATAVIIKLICLCFGWSFDLLVATGIWLVLMLVHWVLSACKSDKN